MKIMFLKYYC